MSEPLWTAAGILAATGGRLSGGFAGAGGASIDTRTLAPGDLFFAVKGEARDGHDFVAQALAGGAAAAVVAEARAGEFGEAAPLVIVDDPLAAMERLGRAARARTAARVAAVTGSVGKTGAKEALRHVLSRQGATHAAAASYNNHWGVPLTLARMPGDAAYGVFEIGMNHAGEILPLTRLVRPHVALVTTVEPVHIEYFPSVAAIADAKGEVFAGLEPGGTAIVNRDNPHYERLRAHAAASPAGRIVTFGEHAGADIRAERIALRPDDSTIEATIFGRALAFRLGTPGRHLAMNALAVLAAVQALGADLDAAAAALASLAPPVGRGERTRLTVAGGEALLIDESYNANPASMRAALATLGALDLAAGGRRIAVLGDMRELGMDGPVLHRDLAGAVEENRVDLVFAAGELMAGLSATLPQSRRALQASAAADLVDPVCAALRPGDAVMIKGSNSVRMALVVEALKERYGPRAQEG